MIEIHSPSAPHAALPSASPRRTDAEPGAFSYALAAAALETKAGAALETFGATPQTGLAETQSDARRAQAPAASQDAAPPPAATSAQAQNPTDARPAPAGAPAPAGSNPPATPPAAQALAGAAAAAPAPLIALPAASQPPAAQPRVIEPVAPRSDATRPAPLSAAKAAAQAPAAAPIRTVEAFAELLARRLNDGASIFELRLDPPELGRVEARVVLRPDGEASVALTFDNDAARDLFARDEGALRAALANAGFDLGGNALSFSLAEKPAPREMQPEPAAALPGADLPALASAPAALIARQTLIDIRI